jgi:hypothetical protein
MSENLLTDADRRSGRPGTITAVYDRAGRYCFYREGGAVYKRDRRAMYVSDGWVFTETGKAVYWVDGASWYGPGGVMMYYEVDAF